MQESKMTRDLNELSTTVQMFEYHRDKTGCSDVAAAILTLVDVIRLAPTDLTDDLLARRGVRSEAAGPVPAPAPVVSNGSITEVKTKPMTNADSGAKEDGKRSRVRIRGDRNRADLQVLEEFMPSDDRKRLAEFLESVGFHINDKHNGQELLTLVVHYVSRMRKTACTHSHIHTVLRKMGVATPADLGARLRDVGRRLKYINPSNGQDVQLTMKGENWVDIELPKRNAAAKLTKK